MRLKRIIKKIKSYLKKKFSRVEYINNYIYKNQVLVNRVALITGGTSGIGLAIAKTFLINGASVIITGRNQEKLDKSINELKKYIAKENNNFIYGKIMDISNIEGIKNDFNDIIRNISGRKIDILVNNAGVILGDNIGKTEIDKYEKCLKTNLEGPYFLSQVIFNYMKENKIKGNILNVLSSSAMRPAVKPYTLSKWGLKGLTLGMAKKFIKYDIVVNGIAPGPTFTPMLVNNELDNNLYLDSSPVKRYITAEEIANCAMFLVSDMGRMIVGDIIYMTGGAGIITVDDIKY